MSEHADTPTTRHSKRGASVDLKGMSAAELHTLITEAEAELKGKQEAAKTELRAKWQAEAEAAGLSLEAIMPSVAPTAPARGRKPRKDAGAPLAAKFRGPNGEEWSGRGRLPKWLHTMEAEGRKREEFRA